MIQLEDFFRYELVKCGDTKYLVKVYYMDGCAQSTGETKEEAFDRVLAEVPKQVIMDMENE